MHIKRALGGAGSGELLDFFLIEKAAYELAYEAANRPGWLAIPIAGARATGSTRSPSRSER